MENEESGAGQAPEPGKTKFTVNLGEVELTDEDTSVIMSKIARVIVERVGRSLAAGGEVRIDDGIRRFPRVAYLDELE